MINTRLGNTAIPAEPQHRQVEIVLPPRQVLCIDDDPSVAVVTQYSLELFNGWYVATTDDRYALELAASTPWDVILLEIGMGYGAGLSLYHRLLADPRTRHIPLVLLTSWVMPADYRRYRQLAIAGVIAKPYNPVTLGTDIAALLDWPTPPSLSN
jgi:CheY-like chemotaxis protein